MLKKIFSVLLAVCAVCCCLLPAASAAAEMGTVKVKLNSDIAGCTERDVDQLIELKSDNVAFRQRADSPVHVSDYAGTMEPGKLVAGRTYYIDYSLVAADGYTLPEKLEDGDVEIECGKGVTVYHTAIVTGNIRGEDGEIHPNKGLRIQASVVVDGNAFQRIIGWFHDLILKIKAWSLY